jgi:hypothetical protein
MVSGWRQPQLISNMKIFLTSMLLEKAPRAFKPTSTEFDISHASFNQGNTRRGVGASGGKPQKKLGDTVFCVPDISKRKMKDISIETTTFCDGSVKGPLSGRRGAAGGAPARRC